MSLRRKAGGGLLAFIGFLLSPLSWWNDFFVNIPLAIGFGWMVAWFHPPLFESAVIVGYWLTNLLGFVLMQKGAQRILSDKPGTYSSKDLWRDVGLSLLYTAVIVVLLKLGFIKPLRLS